MTTWRRTAGDVNDYVDVTIETLANLDAVTDVQAIVWRGDEAVALGAVVHDSALCIIRVSLNGWLNLLDDVRVEQFWALETGLTFLDGSDLTWPDSGDDTIVVDPRRPAVP